MSRFRLREIVSIHIEDHGDVFREGGFLEDVLDVVGEGAGLVGAIISVVRLDLWRFDLPNFFQSTHYPELRA